MLFSETQSCNMNEWISCLYTENTKWAFDKWTEDPQLLYDLWMNQSCYSGNKQWLCNKWMRGSYLIDLFVNESEPEWHSYMAQRKMNELFTLVTCYSQVMKKSSLKWTNRSWATHHYHFSCWRHWITSNSTIVSNVCASV